MSRQTVNVLFARYKAFNADPRTARFEVNDVLGDLIIAILELPLSLRTPEEIQLTDNWINLRMSEDLAELELKMLST